MEGIELTDVAFATTADTGELARQARTLITSLRRVYPNAPVIVFVPTASASDLDTETRAVLEREATLVTGELPLPEYPISAFLRAFVEMTTRIETEYLVALDTDTVIFDRLSVPAHATADVWVRPAEVGAQYWCSEAARGDWERLYNHFDVPSPSVCEFVTTSIDNRRVPPYWNSGVVVSRDPSLAREWLAITRELALNDDLPVDGDEFFLDQLALAIATRKRDVCQFDLRMNYPLGGLLRVPSDVQILHYGETRNLGRVLNPRIREKLRTLGALPPATPAALLQSGLEVASFHSGRLLSYEQKSAARQLVRGVFPTAVRNA